MNGRKIAVVFFTLFCTGALLIASVWHTKGPLGFWVGILGGLLIVIALKWTASALETLEKEKQHARKQEENLYKTPGVSQSWNTFRQSWEITGEPEAPPVFTPGTNPSLANKLSWWFGTLAVAGFAWMCTGAYLRSPLIPEITLGLGLASFIWNALMYAHNKDSFDNETFHQKQNFAYFWGNNAAFRRTNLFIGFLMLVVGGGGIAITPPPPNAGPYIAGTFGGMFVLMITQHFYVQWSLEKGVASLWDGMSIGEKRLQRASDVFILIFMSFGYIVLSRLLANAIQELYFALIFAGAGLLVGYFAHDLLRNSFPGFFTDDERKWAMLAKTYIGCMALTLCVTAAINRATANGSTEMRKYAVTDKSKTYKGKYYLWLNIDGKNKRFEPKVTEWEQARIGDTLPVLVGKGGLGFEVILQFGSPPIDSSIHK